LASAIAAQVAQVLATAHELRSPLHHLALGPGNVRITAAAQVKVLDFGHASLWRGLGQQIGRCAFMAPELLRVRLPAVFDGNGVTADAYSLGALLFFLVSGHAPFQASSFAELLAQVERPLPDLAQAPDQLVRAVRALTSPNPDHRPATATEVVDLLGGKMSADEREQHIANALRLLHIRWGKKSAPPRAQRKSALVGGPRSRWRRLLPVVGAAAGLALGIWLGPAVFQGFRRPASKALPAITTAKASASASLRASHLAETDVPLGRTGIDGGAAADRVYVPMPKRPLPRVPNHLNLDTTPTGADVWVDGVLRGKAPVDLELGPGGHRVVLLQDGQRMHKAVYDTTAGEWIRVPLQAAPSRPTGDALLNVTCRSNNRLPIFIDDEDVGRLCPASMLRVSGGPHKVAVFVPIRRALVETEVTVATGARPTAVVVKD
jgi:hypothetical protein